MRLTSILEALGNPFSPLESVSSLPCRSSQQSCRVQAALPVERYLEAARLVKALGKDGRAGRA